MDRCISYQRRSYELFVPSPIIFSKFCVSYDKTELFIVSLSRLIFYVILYTVIDNSIDLEEHHLIRYILLVNFAINIIYIGFVTFKRPVFEFGSNESVSQFQTRKRDESQTVIPYEVNNYDSANNYEVSNYLIGTPNDYP